MNNLGQAGKELFTRGCCRIHGVVETPGVCPKERFQGGVLLPLGLAPVPWAELVSLGFTQRCEFHLQCLCMEATLIQKREKSFSRSCCGLKNEDPLSIAYHEKQGHGRLLCESIRSRACKQLCRFKWPSNPSASQPRVISFSFNREAKESCEEGGENSFMVHICIF